jgi:hypothetical protein
VTADPVDWDPLRLSPDGDNVVMECTVCGAGSTAALEPTPVLLDTIDVFIAGHAGCYYVAGNPPAAREGADAPPVLTTQTEPDDLPAAGTFR